jgi:ATP-dependent helicase/nuclease subunit A
MKDAPSIPSHILEKQRGASDPAKSVWVSANAGSGKTHVLTQRVVRLLLQGVAPSKILCLTFTKAAAANMSQRVFAALARWTRCADDELREEIVATGAPQPTRADLLAARKLFARTVETPGGLKIQTIHAFCEKLLHHFPFEANVPARFEVADELLETELLGRALREVTSEAVESSGSLGEAFFSVSDLCGAEGFEKLVGDALAERARFRALAHVDQDRALREALGLVHDRNEAEIVREMVDGAPGVERLAEIAEYLDKGKPSDRKRAELLRAAEKAMRSGQVASARLAAYLPVFFTSDGEGTPVVRLVSVDFAKARPELAEELRNEQSRLVGLCEERNGAAACERTAALIILVGAVLERYESMKSIRGVLDFDDLIERTSILLERSDAAWVLYKLDAGIDHVLVDEAQDTSEPQWHILDRITGDFADETRGGRGPRTFFAVGDEKQSIFSFQGAAPHMFATMRRRFEERFIASAVPFAEVSLPQSFRSVSGVLAAVDRVFAAPEHQKGLVANDIWMGHEALKTGLPGVVEIWPPVGAGKTEPRSDWRLPLDYLDETDPASLVAGRVAAKIGRLLAEDSPDRVCDSGTRTARRIRAGDIMVLVRTRGPFFEAVIRALKASKVPVAGADRLVLSRHIAVMDLVAAGRAALLPDDDLCLAALLKSPLIGLDDDDLLEITTDRTGSLRDALARSENPRHRGASQKLDLWRSRAAVGAFAFYARLLGEDGGRRALEARLGPEACDAIDEFLRLALAQDREVAPSLIGFLAEVEALDGSIRRDMESGADCVRVMTVHAAKGLEAKIVLLPDTCAVPPAKYDPKIFTLGEDGPIVWSPAKKFDTGVIAAARRAAREATEEEYRRLLYVALTRAEERVYIGGFHGEKSPAAASWAKMVETSLRDLDGMVEVPAFWNAEETILRYVSDEAPLAPAVEAPREGDEGWDIPSWLSQPVPGEAVMPAAVRPSRLPFERSSKIAGAAASRRVGQLAHMLLQHLPTLQPEARREAALRFFVSRGESEAADLIDAVLGVIAHPQLAETFGPDSRAEVDIVGRIGLPRGGRILVRGRIDRITVTEKDVLVVDFKTGAAPATIQPAYLTQMALYRAVLAPLWPQKRVRMVLVWIFGPSVIRLDEAALDKSLLDLKVAAGSNQTGRSEFSFGDDIRADSFQEIFDEMFFAR